MNTACLGVEAQLLHKRISIQFWHQDVGNDQNRSLTGNHLKGFLTVACREHSISLKAQRDFQQFKHIGNIFDDENGSIKSIHSNIVAAFWVLNKSASFFAMKLPAL